MAIIRGQKTRKFGIINREEEGGSGSFSFESSFEGDGKGAHLEYWGNKEEHVAAPAEDL